MSDQLREVTLYSHDLGYPETHYQVIATGDVCCSERGSLTPPKSWARAPEGWRQAVLRDQRAKGLHGDEERARADRKALAEFMEQGRRDAIKRSYGPGDV